MLYPLKMRIPWPMTHECVLTRANLAVTSPKEDALIIATCHTPKCYTY
jgi:hypothetical protein